MPCRALLSQCTQRLLPLIPGEATTLPPCFDLRIGMAIAMNDTLTGMANEVPLVPGMMPQLHETAGTPPILSVRDGQFDDPATMRLMSWRPAMRSWCA